MAVNNSDLKKELQANETCKSMSSSSWKQFGNNSKTILPVKIE